MIPWDLWWETGTHLTWETVPNRPIQLSHMSLSLSVPSIKQILIVARNNDNNLMSLHCWELAKRIMAERNKYSTRGLQDEIDKSALMSLKWSFQVSVETIAKCWKSVTKHGPKFQECHVFDMSTSTSTIASQLSSAFIYNRTKYM